MCVYACVCMCKYVSFLSRSKELLVTEQCRITTSSNNTKTRVLYRKK